jgi:hypothetical protein
MVGVSRTDTVGVIEDDGPRDSDRANGAVAVAVGRCVKMRYHCIHVPPKLSVLPRSLFHIDTFVPLRSTLRKV